MQCFAKMPTTNPFPFYIPDGFGGQGETFHGALPQICLADYLIYHQTTGVFRHSLDRDPVSFPREGIPRTDWEKFEESYVGPLAQSIALGGTSTKTVRFPPFQDQICLL